MEITYLGHSAFQILFNDKYLVFDPFISDNELAKGIISIPEIKADYLLLTHGHGDHVLDSRKILDQTGAHIISSFELVTWYEEKGYSGHSMNTGGMWEFEFGRVKCVHAVHSNILPDKQYGGPNIGFVIWDDKNCFYVAGYTALTMDMKLIPMICPPLDLAILPIGDNFTMGYEDAVRAAEFIKCNQIIGCHYDTFGYIKLDHDKAKRAFEEKQKKLHLMKIGETIQF